MTAITILTIARITRMTRQTTISILTLLTVFFGYRKKSARIKLYELIKNPVWMINFIVILCFIAYIHFIELSNIKDVEKNE